MPKVKKRPVPAVYCIALLVVAVFIAFFPSLQNGFTNWDDHGLIIDNVSIRSLSWNNIRHIFTSYYIGTYIPLTIVSFAVEYRLVRDDARLYHVTNLLLHLLNCVLVFWLVYSLSGNVLVSLLTALLFGVHPLRVESVAWATERKDVLYSFFYLGALISYVRYIKKPAVLFYVITLGLFILSGLSKGMAAVLTFSLFVIDYYLARRFDKRAIMEKIPFLIITVLIMIVAVYAQKYTEALRPAPLTRFPQTVFIASRNVLFYIFKIAVPAGLSAIYPHPGMKNGLLPLTYLLSPVLVIGLAVGVWRTHRHTRKVLFGCLFFLVNTAMILGLMPVAGPAIVADRYVYVASIGLSFIAAEGFFWLYARRSKHARSFRHALGGVMAGLIIVYGAMTWHRCSIWKNSMLLWDDVIAKYENIPEAYNGRGLAFYDRKEYEDAVKDFDHTVALNPRYVKAYYNRANAYDALGEYDRALADYSQAIHLDTHFSKAYNNRGLVYGRQGRSDLAISDFTTALAIDPRYTSAYNNRGLTYGRIGDYGRAIDDFTNAVRIDPTYVNAYFNRAVTYYRIGQFAKALQDVKKVGELGGSVDPRFIDALRQAMSR